MDKITKKMFDIYVELDGYFLVICDDENYPQKFISEKVKKLYKDYKKTN